MQDQNAIFNKYINPGNEQANEPKPASEKQIQAMKRMGYNGPTEGLTSKEASAWISANQKTTNPQPQYGAPNPYTPPQYQPFDNTPPIQPKEKGQGFQAPSNFTGSNVVTYSTRDGQEMELTSEVINMYLAQQPLTAPEMQYFLSVCKTYQLNPFLKDIYAIKYSEKNPATFVINYQVLQQMADNNPDFDGLETGVIYMDAKGNPQERKGSYILPNEMLLGAWCDVHRKSRNNCNRVYAMYSENVGLDKDGNPNKNWRTKPVFMITKVAKAQALREAFPNMFSNNLYTSDEIQEEEESRSKDYKHNSIDAVVSDQQKYMASVNADIPTDDNGVVDDDYLNSLGAEYGA